VICSTDAPSRDAVDGEVSSRMCGWNALAETCRTAGDSKAQYNLSSPRGRR